MLYFDPINNYLIRYNGRSIVKDKLTLFSLLFLFNQTLFAQDEELCPPAGITVFGGNEENIISWGEPVGNIGCGDFAVNEMPFSHQGNNAGMGDTGDGGSSDGGEGGFMDGGFDVGF